MLPTDKRGEVCAPLRAPGCALAARRLEKRASPELPWDFPCGLVIRAKIPRRAPKSACGGAHDPPSCCSRSICPPPIADLTHFCLAKVPPFRSFRAPCQELEEKQKHGRPSPSASKSLAQGRYSVVTRENATCFNARAASANALSARPDWFRRPTSEMSKRTFPSIDRVEMTAHDPVRVTDGLHAA